LELGSGLGTLRLLGRLIAVIMVGGGPLAFGLFLASSEKEEGDHEGEAAAQKSHIEPVP
jgi:hypothetical protein